MPAPVVVGCNRLPGLERLIRAVIGKTPYGRFSIGRFGQAPISFALGFAFTWVTLLFAVCGRLSVVRRCMHVSDWLWRALLCLALDGRTDMNRLHPRTSSR